VGGKHACVDLTGVSPLVGLSSQGFTAGQTALKAASCKVIKHEKACIKNQHVFIPFVFDTFGFFAPEAVKLLSRVQRVMHSNVVTLRSTDVVFKFFKIVPLRSMGFLDLFSAASMPILKVLIVTALGSYLALDSIDILGQNTGWLGKAPRCRSTIALF
nr:auxilin-like protein [Tanacetum cinerariifolium]